MDTSNSWQELIQNIQFLKEESDGSISTEIETATPIEAGIAAFEQQHNIVFPPDYREFCKLFGSGMAGDLFRFWCPGCAQLADRQEDLILTPNYIRKFPSDNPEVDRQKIEILENGFIFADNLGSHILLWDLRTYRNEDSSYDIYYALWDAPESDVLEDDIKFVGRSFFELVRDFCYGSRRYELHPPDECVDVEYTYYRFDFD